MKIKISIDGAKIEIKHIREEKSCTACKVQHSILTNLLEVFEKKVESQGKGQWRRRKKWSDLLPAPSKSLKLAPSWLMLLNREWYACLAEYVFLSANGIANKSESLCVHAFSSMNDSFCDECVSVCALDRHYKSDQIVCVHVRCQVVAAWRQSDGARWQAKACELLQVCGRPIEPCNIVAVASKKGILSPFLPWGLSDEWLKEKLLLFIDWPVPLLHPHVLCGNHFGNGLHVYLLANRSWVAAVLKPEKRMTCSMITGYCFCLPHLIL